MSHDCMWASHLVWNATRLSIIRAKSLPEKLSSATSNAARFEPRDFLAILKPSVRMKNHYTKVHFCYFNYTSLSCTRASKYRDLKVETDRYHTDEY